MPEVLERQSSLESAVHDRGMLSGTELVARVQRVREVMRDLMTEGVHYGRVPGTQKPSLLKPGAELLLMTFRIGPKLDVEDLSNEDEIRYRVKVTGFYQPTGEVLAEGIGEASTNEEKYRWRAAVHEKEWAATPADLRRIKYTRDGKETPQIRTSPADLANTVLLMAVKRGTVNMTRVVTACSDIFDQDVEDLPEELRQAGSGQTPGAAAQKVQQPQRNGETTKPQASAANQHQPQQPQTKPAAGAFDPSATYTLKKIWQPNADKPYRFLELVSPKGTFTVHTWDQKVVALLEGKEGQQVRVTGKESNFDRAPYQVQKAELVEREPGSDDQ